MYKIEFKKEADEGLLRLQKSGDKQALKKIDSLLKELKIHPRTGTGHPEPLKYHDTDRWSRHITQKHRLVYDIYEQTVTVEIIQTYGHYHDK